MRQPRLVRIDTFAIYSICAKVVEGLFRFDVVTKISLTKLLQDVADFCGVLIIDFSIMTNHFHILAEVPPKSSVVSDDEVIRRVGVLYGEKKRLAIKQAVDAYKAAGNTRAIKDLLAPYRARMNDLSQFMKTFMQLATMRYNKAHNREGTLWQGRFHSTLVERTRDLGIVRWIAGYIDLNAMRAGMVEKPEDYRWCTFGVASRHGKERAWARRGLAFLYPGIEEAVFMRKYRKFLMARFAQRGLNKKKAVSDSSCPDLSERQPSLCHARAIGSPEFLLRTLGKLPRRGVSSLPGGLLAVGGERARQS